MNRERYRELLDALGLSQVDAARFLNYDARTVRRWALGEYPVPCVVAILLQIMVAREISPNAARKIASIKDEI